MYAYVCRYMKIIVIVSVIFTALGKNGLVWQETSLVSSQIHGFH
jgi:hypothetical protein